MHPKFRCHAKQVAARKITRAHDTSRTQFPRRDTANASSTHDPQPRDGHVRHACTKHVTNSRTTPRNVRDTVCHANATKMCTASSHKLCMWSVAPSRVPPQRPQTCSQQTSLFGLVFRIVLAAMECRSLLKQSTLNRTRMWHYDMFFIPLHLAHATLLTLILNGARKGSSVYGQHAPVECVGYVKDIARMQVLVARAILRRL